MEGQIAFQGQLKNPSGNLYPSTGSPGRTSALVKRQSWLRRVNQGRRFTSPDIRYGSALQQGFGQGSGGLKARRSRFPITLAEIEIDDLGSRSDRNDRGFSAHDCLLTRDSLVRPSAAPDSRRPRQPAAIHHSCCLWILPIPSCEPRAGKTMPESTGRH